jgi:hypothetical protein
VLWVNCQSATFFIQSMTSPDISDAGRTCTAAKDHPASRTSKTDIDKIRKDFEQSIDPPSGIVDKKKRQAGHPPRLPQTNSVITANPDTGRNPAIPS